MMEVLDTLTVAGGGATAFAALLWFIDRRMPKAKSAEEMADSVVAGLRGTITFQGEQIDALENDVKGLHDDLRVLRKELRDNSIKAHKLYTAIQNFLIDYPHHGEWWAKKL